MKFIGHAVTLLISTCAVEKRDQADVIEKILKHCKLWIEPEQRGPPDVRSEPEVIDFILEPESQVTYLSALVLFQLNSFSPTSELNSEFDNRSFFAHFRRNDLH